MSDDVFRRVEQRVDKLTLRWQFRMSRAVKIEQLNSLIDQAKDHALSLDSQHGASTSRAESWLYALVLQAPRAAQAQAEMDKHPHGYHNKQQRLLELIDFNDAFVSTVLAMPRELLPRIHDELWRLFNKICKKVGSRRFSEQEYDAIGHGLSREVAVYLGAIKEGYEPQMTSRVTDAFGIDMRILDPRSQKSVNVDIKTRSAYHYRIRDLEREGRISQEEVAMADRNGFVAVYNGKDSERVRVVVWRIDTDLLGEVVDFQFKDTRALGQMLRKIVAYVGEEGTDNNRLI